MESVHIIQLKGFLHRLTHDTRLRPIHISLSLALCHAWMEQGCCPAYRITRKMLMQASGIRAIGTYHKTLHALLRFGYLTYKPSYHPAHASEVMLIL